MADFLSFLFFFKVKITRMQHMVPISGWRILGPLRPREVLPPVSDIVLQSGSYLGSEGCWAWLHGITDYCVGRYVSKRFTSLPLP
jgi:hypothetical protein